MPKQSAIPYISKAGTSEEKMGVMKDCCSIIVTVIIVKLIIIYNHTWQLFILNAFLRNFPPINLAGRPWTTDKCSHKYTSTSQDCAEREDNPTMGNNNEDSKIGR